MTRTKFGHLDKYVRLKIPVDLAAALRLEERKKNDTHSVQRRIICQDGRINLELTFGATGGDNRFDVGHVTYPNFFLPIPHFFSRAWNLTAAYSEGDLDGYVEWPAPTDVNTTGETVTITLPVKHGPPGASERDGENIELFDWQPARDTDIFASLEMPTHVTSLTGSPDSTIKGAIPTQLAREMEIDGDTRLEVTMDCIDGRKVLFATATDEPQSAVQNSVSIYMGGPNKKSRRFTASRLASLLDVRGRLEYDSVRLKWSGYQDVLMAYVADE